MRTAPRGDCYDHAERSLGAEQASSSAEGRLILTWT
jgi:hypothetical protein